MANRITVEKLELEIDELNRLVDKNPYDREAGSYFRSGAFGGHKLEMHLSSVTTENVFGIGYRPVREVYLMTKAYRRGLVEGFGTLRRKMR